MSARLPLGRALLCAALALALALTAALGGTALAAGTVHMRGTAYEFNKTGIRLAGATIKVVERPTLSATVGADGRYDLVVPDHAQITPYIVAEGHHTIHLQTFTTDGEDLDRVNFQTPSEPIYQALAALLSVPLNPDGQLSDCAIVSTFSTVGVRDLDFDAFTAFGAHGVAGASAAASPSLGSPTYFNEDVIPDPAQKDSSKDGGVIWTRVPAGRYTITATHPTKKFASFVATCAPGRIVNANPPWGLHELAPASPAKVAFDWKRTAGVPMLRGLRVSSLPEQPVVRAACSGRGCPFATRNVPVTGATVDVRAALGSRARRLGAGQTLTVTVTGHGVNGLVVGTKLRRGVKPRTTVRCIPLGQTRPRERC